MAETTTENRRIRGFFSEGAALLGQTRNGLSKGLLQNLHLKIIALFIAYGIWFAVTSEELLVQDMTVPVQYINLPDKFALSGKTPESVKVRVQAPVSILRKLTGANVDVRLDLADANVGNQFFRLTQDETRVPYGVRVKDIVPSTLILTIEPMYRKEVPVRPRLEGAPAPGYDVKAVKSDPATVKVRGARSEVEKVRDAVTSTIYVEQRKMTLTELATLDVGNPNLHIVGPDKAKVTVVIGQVSTTRRVGRMPVRTDSCPGLTVRFTPSVVTAVVQGPAGVIGKLTAVDLKAIVKVPFCVAGQKVGEAPVSVELPKAALDEGVAVVGIDPTKVAVRVSGP